MVNGQKYITVPHKSFKSIKLRSVTGRMVKVTATENKDGSGGVESNVAAVRNLFVNGSSYGARMLVSNLKSSSFVIHNKGKNQSKTFYSRNLLIEFPYTGHFALPCKFFIT